MTIFNILNLRILMRITLTTLLQISNNIGNHFRNLLFFCLNNFFKVWTDLELKCQNCYITIKLSQFQVLLEVWCRIDFLIFTASEDQIQWGNLIWHWKLGDTPGGDSWPTLPTLVDVVVCSIDVMETITVQLISVFSGRIRTFCRLIMLDWRKTCLGSSGMGFLLRFKLWMASGWRKWGKDSRPESWKYSLQLFWSTLLIIFPYLGQRSR